MTIFMIDFIVLFKSKLPFINIKRAAKIAAQKIHSDKIKIDYIVSFER